MKPNPFLRTTDPALPAKSPLSFSGSSAFILLFLLVALCQPCTGAGIPLGDFVFYGKVYTSAGQQVIGTTAAITVKRNTATGPTDPVIATTSTLLDPGSGQAEFYVLRIPRQDSGTVSDGSFLVPGDVLHIYVGGVEVQETKLVSILTTNAVQELQRMDLNRPFGPDTDFNGLPDTWESQFFGVIGVDPNGDPNKTGVTNFLAYALGLDPRVNNASKMPFLQTGANGDLFFYFRRSATETGLTYRIEATGALGVGAWQPCTGGTLTDVGVDGGSKIIKLTVPGGVNGSLHFFHLVVQGQ